MNRRGFLKGVFGSIALAGAALAIRPVEALETITGGRDGENGRPIPPMLELRPGPVYDTDFGYVSLSATASAGTGGTNGVVERLENQVRELDPGYFNDGGHPEVWIDLDSFYHAGDGLPGKVGDMNWRDHVRRMRARRDKFRNLTPAPEGALMHDYKTESPMEVQ